MTKKKEDILIHALSLFAENGYDSTSTRMVAQSAGVSEGLIFKHFGNKVGLLDAVIEKGTDKAQEYFSNIIEQRDPKERILMTLALPVSIDDNDHQFWKLLYALKWQRGIYDETLFEELLISLEKAFSELGYEDSAQEARLLQIYIDGLALDILLKQNNPQDLLALQVKKYNI